MTPIIETAPITDEMVERAAKAICNHGKFHNHDAWLYADRAERDRMRELARAALESALNQGPPQ